jgi:hypothetical protein
MTLYRDKLRRRAKKVQKTKLLRKFDPTQIIIAPLITEKAD